jgi:transcriptional regulator with XRE-family HTH domain
MLPPMVERHLGQHFLRQWRLHRSLSLRQLADRMEKEPGVPLTSHANIDRIEKRQQPYQQEIMEAAALALDCTVPELLTINPLKDGDVIDLMPLLKDKDPAVVRAILMALPSAKKPG